MEDEEIEDMSYENLVQATIQYLDEFEKAKKEHIIILAKKLEKLGTPKDMISQQISRDLEGRVSSSYVRRCLAKDYKDRKQIRENSTSRPRESTPADNSKKVLVSITKKGRQENTKELPMPAPEEIPKANTLDTKDNDETTVDSLQNKLRNVELRSEYFAKALAERSPELPDLYERIRQLKEIETERTKQDFVSAESLNEINRLQQEVNRLQRELDERESLLANNTFHTDFELKDQMIPLIIVIDRKSWTAKATIDTSKVKSLNF
jgi:hypothetical protein